MFQLKYGESRKCLNRIAPPVGLEPRQTLLTTDR